MSPKVPLIAQMILGEIGVRCLAHLELPPVLSSCSVWTLLERKLLTWVCALHVTTRINAMQRRIVSSITLAIATLVLGYQNIAAADDPHTLADCEAAYSQCFASAGFFGFFFCPQQYTQCVAQVRSRLAPEVTQVLDQVNACSRADATCRTASEGDSDKLASCSRKQTLCVMDAFGVQPSPDSAKDRLCVQDAVMCLNASETRDQLDACGQSLRNCLDHPAEPAAR